MPVVKIQTKTANISCALTLFGSLCRNQDLAQVEVADYNVNPKKIDSRLVETRNITLLPYHQLTNL